MYCNLWSWTCNHTTIIPCRYAQINLRLFVPRAVFPDCHAGPGPLRYGQTFNHELSDGLRSPLPICTSLFTVDTLHRRGGGHHYQYRDVPSCPRQAARMSDPVDDTVPADVGANQQRFKCSYCDRRFKRLDHVQRHERRHTKETPYKCPCGQAYPRQ